MIHLKDHPVQQSGLMKPSAKAATSGKSIAVVDKTKVPLSRGARIKEIMGLPTKAKAGFLPPVGTVFRLGPYVFKVAVQNQGDLRFTARLHDVIIEGING